jgi:SAM-dependent methyltransferase
MSDDSPELGDLRRRLEQEEAAYAAALDALDRLAAPAPAAGTAFALRARLNELCAREPPPFEGGGLFGGAGAARRADALAAQQREFSSVLVQFLNAEAEERAAHEAHRREALGALLRYVQRVLPVVDARDRMASALSTTRAELILEAFDRRLASLGQRLTGLLALRDRVEVIAEETRALRPAAAAAPVAMPPPPSPDDVAYVAFENRFRGSRDEIRGRLASYVPLFAGRAPVADLGCGRGEFLELLREAQVEAVGAESNTQAVEHCRARGLQVSATDLLTFLRGRGDGSLGGVFAAQVAEHLPPPVLMALLRESHRVLRAGGLLVLETVNPRSVTGFLEVYNRDLTHERPLHPDTLSFLAAAAGFGEVQVELRSPVDPAAQLQPVPTEGLPPRTAEALNENLARLNALLYGPQEYALLATR